MLYKGVLPLFFFMSAREKNLQKGIDTHIIV